jgi:cytochrome c peroxidase
MKLYQRIFFSAQLLASVVSVHSSAAPRTDEPIQVIPTPPNLSPEKVQLGKMLFFDPRLSKSGFLSCNSCHNLSTAGADNLPSSIGHGWQIGPINSPTVLNASLHFAQFWDGRAKDLREQAVGPMANPGEMASTHENAIAAITSIAGYLPRFAAAYGDEKVTLDRVADAIATFEETLLTPDSKFDRWLNGDDAAITSAELKGYELFKQKGCVGCHLGPAVGGSMYQKMGLVHPYTRDKKTLGRFNVTKKPQDRYVFKVPSLRNIELTAPYFHDGSVWTLAEAVDLMAWHQLGIKLTKDENAAIVEFLRTLTGQMPRIELPILPPSSEKTPRPNFK